MKLELKHLAPYLPYGLKGVNRNGTIFLLHTNTSSGGKLEKREISTFLSEEFKPILHPLSDLEEFSPAIYNYLVKNCENYVVRLQQIDYNVLIENHFDVFKLIENGLAIDINSLPHISE